MNKLPKRGEVWGIQLGSGWGHEQSAARYCLIIAHDELNENYKYFGVVIVIPTTSKGLDKPHPFRVRVAAGEANLPQATAFMCDQILRIDPEARLGQCVGRVSSITLHRVEEIVRNLLDL
ncbi:MAG TPA: type II toxin-antitoxin system PemK/MazF family toxin [Candidatus Obscuribacterales bacterium]